ncbi:DUF2092 domain-containing protein [Georgenia wutianyii]|uniref:DUF2092 domain-containing protein n=1 Tax=Georgenia wutianyii TaxID=2585135 RepID=A0ABX5VNB4_9MICO|nr:DUF2092 domain-containing protein [Georgenia wutianyii]QDB79952.1 DUF2092 domain-containing protein [Georgenia wutianyii]
MARSTWHRWLPAGAVVALIAGTVTITSQAGAVDLPDKSPQDVLAMLAENDVTAFSGTFETSTDLGLPLPSDIDLGPGSADLEDADLPTAAPEEDGAQAQEALSALALLSGDNTGRVFVAGPGTMRLQHLDGLDERNLVLTPQDAWFYDSQTNEALHVLLPDTSGLPEPPAPDGPLPTPQDLAEMAVEALEPSTGLTVGQDESVAGRDAYTLTLTPRAQETLVGSVTIAVDGENGFPLAVTVTARGQSEPALHAAYTEIDFSAPDAALFDFTPPAGAAVEEEVLELPDLAALEEEHDAATAPEGQVLGEGWASVLETQVGGLPDDPLLDQLTDPVPGGRVLSTSLLTVLLTDDGRVLAGAVTPEHLLALAGR